MTEGTAYRAKLSLISVAENVYRGLCAAGYTISIRDVADLIKHGTPPQSLTDVRTKGGGHE